jgi:diguanylate cyclase (GGDEF)-like protein/PAS domain S-box-containing protein
LLSLAGFVVACAIAYTAVYNHQVFQEEVTSKTYQQLSTISKLQAKSFEDMFTRIVNDLGVVAVYQNLYSRKKDIEGHRNTPLSHTYDKVKNIVSSMYRIDRRGVVRERQPFLEDRIGENFSEKPGVKYVLNEKKPYISKVFITNSGKKAISVCVPVFAFGGTKGDLVGVLRALLYVDMLVDRLESIQVGEGGHAWIENSASGEILGSPNKEHTGKMHHAVYDENQWLIARTPMDLLGRSWSLGVAIPYSEMAATIRANALRSLVPGLFAFLLFGGAGAYLVVSGRKTAQLQAKAEVAEALEASERQFRTLIENAADIITIVDETDTFTYGSPSLRRLGFEVGEVVGRTPADFILPEDLTGVMASLQESRDNPGALVEMPDFRVHRKDGSVAILEGQLIGLVDVEGIEGVVFSGRDITERKQAEEALRQSEERHRIVLEFSPDPIAVYDMEGQVTYLNSAFTNVFGWTLEDRRERGMDFVPEECRPQVLEMLTRIKNGEVLSGIETRRFTKSGHTVDVSVSGASFFDTEGRHLGNIATFQDITVRRRSEEEIRYLAYHDGLTGLPNRKSFYEHLEGKLAGGRRSGESTWALLFLDLDKFKYVNDNLGHDAGDELLKIIAGRLQGSLRKSDSLFRLGGDEFTITLNDLSEGIDVARVAEKIRHEVTKPCILKGVNVSVDVSVGISVYPEDGDGVEIMVKNADMAMYAAKESGEGYHFFTGKMNTRAMERMQMERSLRQAVEAEQLRLLYQPIVDVGGRILGVEALLRWEHPEMGLVRPAQFIPIAEEIGTIVPMGKWVLAEASRQAKAWHDKGLSWLYLSVNVSARQFREPDFVEMVELALEESGLAPGQLKLELTESGVMENPEEAIAKMKMLRAKGVLFAIDDFGTGYSSLNYLKRFPLDALKIDRSFVADALTNRDDREIIRTIIAMARSLGMETVAEGIETKAQQELLSRLGCDSMQGYYFGRPMPGKELEQRVSEANVASAQVEELSEQASSE